MLSLRISLPRPQTNTQTIAIALSGVLLLALVVAVHAFYSVGVDWRETYSQVSDHWRNPYAIPTFTNPPWITALLPHAWLPLSWGNAVNFVLNLTIIGALIMRYRGGG